jgi:hypothetical protein
VIWRFAVPWYWTDDIARALIEAGRLSVEAARAMLEDDEIPIAA